MNFIFFGTPQVSVEILEILKSEGLLPSLIITSPDRPQGRGLKLAPPPVKIWAKNNNISVLQPEKLDSEFIKTLDPSGYTLFAVVAYGKILPKEILQIPKKGVLNLHYSLLPHLRGASPVETAILENINPTGVSVMLMDEKMDHGPILAQKEIYFENWPLSKEKVFKKLNEIGGQLLAEAMKDWLADKIKPQEQNHQNATYTEKIKKEDGLINFDDEPELNYRKFLAYHPSPGIYCFEKDKRIKITDASLRDGKFTINKVVPEGKKEVEYEQFLKSN